jgi:glycosyltransferase involved in cell wall biosynthesis
VDDFKISVVIPYRQRLRNIRIAFAALTEQTMDRASFQVVVGALEYSPEYLAVAQEFADRLTIVSVLVDVAWNTSRARNIAIRQATGQVVVFLDADMAVPPTFLQNLYDRYYSHRQNVCVVGQMVGYDQTAGHDTEVPEAVSYEWCREILAGYEAQPTAPLEDKRWRPEYAQAAVRLPWALLRTAIAAVPRELIARHQLLFDEGFQGWGPEDQEWAFRISQTGTPILLCRDVYAVHLPHERSTTANGASAWANNRYYLRKWPRLDLELTLAFGKPTAAEVYPAVERELAEIVGDRRCTLGLARGTIGGRDTLVVGASLDAATKAPALEVAALFDGWRVREVYPLAGFAQPYEDQSVDVCRILAPVMRLSERYRDAIIREAERVSDKVVLPTD